MSKICPKCGREFMSSRAERCPICDILLSSKDEGDTQRAVQIRQYPAQREGSGRAQISNLRSCPECGKRVSRKAVTCPGCGHPFEKTKFCKFCGFCIPVDSIICTKCGRQVENIGGMDKGIVINNNNNNNVSSAASAVAVANGMQGFISPKSRIVTLLLCLFLGWFAIHRFYVGKIGTGILMIFLMFTGIGEIWLVIDFFIILFGGFTDVFGRRIINW